MNEKLPGTVRYPGPRRSYYVPVPYLVHKYYSQPWCAVINQIGPSPQTFLAYSVRTVSLR